MALTGSDAASLDRGAAAREYWHCSWAWGLRLLIWRGGGGARMGSKRGGAYSGLTMGHGVIAPMSAGLVSFDGRWCISRSDSWYLVRFWHQNQ